MRYMPAFDLRRFSSLIRSTVALGLLISAVPLAGAWPRGGGSFGGGRSFGGSFGGGRSFGGSFGSSRSSGGFSSFGGSFGKSSGGSFGSRRSSSAGSFGGSRSTGGSFGRTGSFGTRSFTRSSSIAPSYYGQHPYSTSNYYYGGRYIPAYHYGFWSGYSFMWGAPMWYYWTPFHPAFYYYPPVFYGGAMYPGGFNWGHFILSALFFVALIWLIARVFFVRKGVRYTTY